MLYSTGIVNFLRHPCNTDPSRDTPEKSKLLRVEISMEYSQKELTAMIGALLFLKKKMGLHIK